MGRLTEKMDGHFVARSKRVDGLYAGVQACLDKLGELEDTEEQGLLLRLPCKIGAKLYDVSEFLIGLTHPEMYVLNADRIEISKDEHGIVYTIDSVDYRESDFGNTVFTSEVEAWGAVTDYERARKWED